MFNISNFEDFLFLFSCIDLLQKKLLLLLEFILEDLDYDLKSAPNFPVLMFITANFHTQQL